MTTESEFNCDHIDTCLGSFLNDHHNRDGELLLGVFVDGRATVGVVLDGLRDEYHQVAYEIGSNRLGFDYAQGSAAIENFIAENKDNREKLFDSSLDVLTADDDYDEIVQAWFLISWDVPEESCA